jgi:hypothetical protein
MALANAAGGYIWNTKEGLEAMKIFLAATNGTPAASVWRENKHNPKEAMKIFLAGYNYKRDILKNEGVLNLIGKHKICVLESFYYMQDWMKPYIRDHWDFLLDSGAFTFMNDKKNSSGIDWDAYLTRYINFINEMDIDQFFELDIDAVVGLKRVEELRTRLESETGKKCIPVWHKSRGKEYWYKMCEEYDYVALGGMAADKKYKDKVEELFPWFIQEARKRKTKIHCLGYTSLSGLEKYKFYSVDSTAWVYGNRGGYIYQFNGRTLDKIDKPKGTKLKSKAVAIHNFKEWVNFQLYAKNHL